MNSISTSLAVLAAVVGSIAAASANPERDPGDEITPGGVSSLVNCTVIQQGGATDDLWWFGGANAAFYSERVRLKAKSRTFAFRPPFVWTVIEGMDKVEFNNGTDQIATSGFRVALKATAASAGSSSLQHDIKIRVSNSAGLFCDFTTVVLTPDHVVALGALSFPNESGYYTDFLYRTEDQFNRVLPNLLELNNDWGAETSDFAGENWGWLPELGVYVGAFRWCFRIDRGSPLFSIPPTMNPQAPRSTLMVDHRDGSFRHGSVDVQPGGGNNGGLIIGSGRFQTYDDHATFQ
jgi:hypothetical protein